MNGGVSREEEQPKSTCWMELFSMPQTKGGESTGLRRARWKPGELGDRRTEALGTSQPEKREWETLIMAGWRRLRREGERGSG